MARKAFGTRLAAFAILFSSLGVSAAPAEIDVEVEHARLVGALPLSGKLFHVQGVELDQDRIWVTSVSRWNGKGFIHEFDRTTGHFKRRLELTDGPRFHPGGISINGSSIWVPMGELRANSSSVLLEVDKASLQIRRRIRVADHLGCVAASDSMLIAGNWDSKLLYIFDLTGTKPMRVVPNPSQTRYQDMKLIDGQLVAGGVLTSRSGSIDWIDVATMRLTRSLRTGATESDSLLRPAVAYNAEGMALKGRDLYLVPEDGPSRLFHFRLDETLAIAGR